MKHIFLITCLTIFATLHYVAGKEVIDFTLTLFHMQSWVTLRGFLILFLFAVPVGLAYKLGYDVRQGETFLQMMRRPTQAGFYKARHIDNPDEWTTVLVESKENGDLVASVPGLDREFEVYHFVDYSPIFVPGGHITVRAR